jgi:hypothetical protein
MLLARVCCSQAGDALVDGSLVTRVEENTVIQDASLQAADGEEVVSQSKKLKMKGIIWNSNGFRDPSKHHFVSDTTREHNLAFISILEMGRSNFNDTFLKNLCAGIFLWHFKAPQGQSGGILLCIDLDVFDIGAIDEGDFYVKFHLCNKDTYFKWALVVVYGPAQDPQNFNSRWLFLFNCVINEGDFYVKFHERLPVLMGGDFNILRHADEKNKENFNSRWLFLFNCVIDGLNL